MKKRLTKPKKEFPLDKYLFASINKIWGWWPPRREALKNATSKRDGVNGQTCTCCGDWFPELCVINKKGRKVWKRQVQVDHIEPVVPVTGFVDWNTHIARKFVSVDKLQVLWKPHHQEKSNKENSQRREPK